MNCQEKYENINKKFRIGCNGGQAIDSGKKVIFVTTTAIIYKSDSDYISIYLVVFNYFISSVK